VAVIVVGTADSIAVAAVQIDPVLTIAQPFPANHIALNEVVMRSHPPDFDTVRQICANHVAALYVRECGIADANPVDLIRDCIGLSANADHVAGNAVFNGAVVWRGGIADANAVLRIS